jgi:hypothetical protein
MKNITGTTNLKSKASVQQALQGIVTRLSTVKEQTFEINSKVFKMVTLRLTSVQYLLVYENVDLKDILLRGKYKKEKS